MTTEPLQPTPAEPMHLDYAPPLRRGVSPVMAICTMFIVLFVCATSIALFAIVAERRLDPWPAAIAVVSMDAMALGCVWLMSRHYRLR